MATKTTACPTLRAARAASLATLVAIAGPVAAAPLTGTVVTPALVPVEGAQVELIAIADGDTTGALPGPSTVTGRDGGFVLDPAALPLRLRVTHPRFQTATLHITRPEPATITLTPLHQFLDRVVVTDGRGRRTIRPVSVAVGAVGAADAPESSDSVVEMVQGLPGVAENGQGGRFQAYSIRGIAGQRVQSLVAGARIVTERRAGATASFIDPFLLSEVEVVRGPYSSYYGSSALGGVLNAVPARFASSSMSLGYEGEGHARRVRVGTGGDRWSLGVAYGGADDAETADGLPLFSRYQQWSASFLREFELQSGGRAEILIVPAAGRDIGKPNSRYPARTTIYPQEDHLITRFRLSRADGWQVQVWAHPNELETLNTRSTQREMVDNRAFDFGLNLEREHGLAHDWIARFGFDYFGRRGVTGRQRLEVFETGDVTETATLDGWEDELAAYASLRRGFGRTHVEFGGRYIWLGQGNAGAPSTDDTAVTGFLGATVSLRGGLELVVNLGSGLRFPGLSERFFSGATGRGEVFANPGLQPERAVSTDLGLRWFGRRALLAAYLFHNEIDNYIEQVELDDGVTTFDNLTAGTIEGLELEGFYDLGDGLRLTWSGQAVTGRSDENDPLADVAADRIQAGLTWSRHGWRATGRWQHRFAKDDPGPGELAVEPAEVVSASLAYRVTGALTLTLSATNLLDETYLPSADDLAVPAQRRSVGLDLRWEPPRPAGS
jgi:outer membrane receptor protein involved in Fe transport